MEKFIKILTLAVGIANLAFVIKITIIYSMAYKPSVEYRLTYYASIALLSLLSAYFIDDYFQLLKD